MSETANQPTDATAGAEPDAIPPDPANPAPPAGPLLPAWAESRISTITRKYRDEERARALAEAKMAELQGRLDAIGLGSPQGSPQGAGAGPAGENPPGDIESQIQTRAAALAETARFTEQCNDIARKGRAAFADFGEVIKNYGTYLGGLPNSIVEGALETDDPHITIYELGKDMAEATRIAGLSPARQAAAVARFAGKLAKSASAAGNALAAAVAGGTGAAPAALPPPIQAKVGSANNGTGRQGAVRLDDEKVSMEDWIKTRNESMKRR